MPTVLSNVRFRATRKWSAHGQNDAIDLIRTSPDLDPQLRLLGPDFSADRGSEQFTVFTVESRHLHLLDGKIVGRASIDLDARKQQPEFEILEVGCLSHDVLAGEFVAALLEYLNYGLRCQIAVNTERARFISLREVLIHEGGPFLDRGIVPPGRVGRILEVVGRQNALRIFKAGRLEHGTDRVRDAGKEQDGLPADLRCLPDRLRSKFRRSFIKKDIGAKGLKRDDLTIDSRVGGLVGDFANDHALFCFRTEAVLETVEIV